MTYKNQEFTYKKPALYRSIKETTVFDSPLSISSSPFYRFTTRISLHWKTDTCTLGIPKRSSNSRIPMRKSMKLKDTHLKPLLPNTSPPEKWFSLEVTITQYSSIIGMSSIRPS